MRPESLHWRLAAESYLHYWTLMMLLQLITVPLLIRLSLYL